MADISPFLSTPQTMIVKLAALRDERKKLEAREEKLRAKIEEHLRAKGVDRLAADGHEVRLEKRESVDFSQKALSALYGSDWLDDAKKRLPTREVTSLRLIDVKSVEKAVTPAADKKMKDDISSFFGS